MALSFNDVNKRGSFTWVKCNDDAKSAYFRNSFVSMHGGEFIKIGRYWEWNPTKEQIIILEPVISKPAKKEVKFDENEKFWVFLSPEGKEIKTNNLHDFCREYNLTRSSLYEVISGRRKNHKGFTYIEVKNKKETP